MSFFPYSFFAVITILHLYPLWSVYRTWRNPIGAAPFLFALAAFFIIHFTRHSWDWRQSTHVVLVAQDYWLGFVVMLSVALIIRDAFDIAFRIVGFVSGNGFQRRTSRNSMLAAFLAGIALYGYALGEAQDIRVRTLDIVSDRIAPGNSPLRIVFLADLHITITTSMETLGEIVDLINAQEPDMVILGGDVVDAESNLDSECAPTLRHIRAPGGKFAVTGNHDARVNLPSFLALMEGADFDVLRGESRDAAGIRLAGVDDPDLPSRKEILDVLDREDGGRFVLLISHRPEVPAKAIGLFDLELAGHTHGGQVWPFSLASRIRAGWPQGLSRITAPAGGPREESLLYISNGVRYWGVPVRFLAPPDIVVVTLRAAETGKGIVSAEAH